jgi:sulfite exporter TauE/SafE/copper chaperone CopZ
MSKTQKKITSTTIRIAGMHCPSCDILVKTQLESMDTILEVVPDHKRKLVTIKHSKPLSLQHINSILCEYGYEATSLDEVVVEEPFSSKLTEVLIIGGILAIGYYFAKEFNLLPESIGGSVTTVGGAFFLGLIASASTCMATTGALFTSFLHRQKARKASIVQVAALFIVGRVISYAVFGYVLGYFGKGFAYLTQFGSLLNIVVAIVLIIAGLDMLRLLSLSQILDFLHIQPSRLFPSFNRPRAILGGAFTLGLITYFLPCGFSISTQAFALGSGNPMLSSQIMTAFALGTIPSLIFITALSHVRNNTIYLYFIKVVGIIIFVVGCNYVWSTLTLHGFSLFSNSIDKEFSGELAEIVDGKQFVKMTATSSGYSPNKFVVKKNIPVRWEVDGKEIYGCQGTLQSPQAGIELTYLKEGENVFEFIPKDIGIINFSCSMGMFSGQFMVIEN